METPKLEEIVSIVETDAELSSNAGVPVDKKSGQEQISLFGNITVDQHIELTKTQMLVRDRASERNLRRKHSDRSFKFSIGWAIFIALLILLKGFGKFLHFELSSTEFLTVIGSLTATILTYYMIVLNYLFPKQKDKTSKIN